MESTEKWLPAVGYEDLYEVSDAGRVRKGDLVLRPWTLRNGYEQVALWRGGKRQRFTVHRLVALAFHGESELQVRHLNGIRSDNRAVNLRWGTISENAVDRVSHGTDHNAKKTHCKRGHEFTPQNTRVQTFDGGRQQRQCITCNKQRRREEWLREKNLRKAS